MSVFVTFPFFGDKLRDGVGGLRRGGFFVDVVANVGISVIFSYRWWIAWIAQVELGTTGQIVLLDLNQAFPISSRSTTVTSH